MPSCSPIHNLFRLLCFFVSASPPIYCTALSTGAVAYTIERTRPASLHANASPPTGCGVAGVSTIPEVNPHHPSLTTHRPRLFVRFSSLTCLLTYLLPSSGSPHTHIHTHTHTLVSQASDVFRVYASLLEYCSRHIDTTSSNLSIGRLLSDVRPAPALCVALNGTFPALPHCYGYFIRVKLHAFHTTCKPMTANRTSTTSHHSPHSPHSPLC